MYPGQQNCVIVAERTLSSRRMCILYMMTFGIFCTNIMGYNPLNKSDVIEAPLVSTIPRLLDH